eukprot:403333385
MKSPMTITKQDNQQYVEKAIDNHNSQIPSQRHSTLVDNHSGNNIGYINGNRDSKNFSQQYVISDKFKEEVKIKNGSQLNANNMMHQNDSMVVLAESQAALPETKQLNQKELNNQIQSYQNQQIPQNRSKQQTRHQLTQDQDYYDKNDVKSGVDNMNGNSKNNSNIQISFNDIFINYQVQQKLMPQSNINQSNSRVNYSFNTDQFPKQSIDKSSASKSDKIKNMSSQNDSSKFYGNDYSTLQLKKASLNKGQLQQKHQQKFVNNTIDFGKRINMTNNVSKISERHDEESPLRNVHHEPNYQQLHQKQRRINTLSPDTSIHSFDKRSVHTNINSLNNSQFAQPLYSKRSQKLNPNGILAQNQLQNRLNTSHQSRGNGKQNVLQQLTFYNQSKLPSNNNNTLQMSHTTASGFNLQYKQNAHSQHQRRNIHPKTSVYMNSNPYQQISNQINQGKQYTLNIPQNNENQQQLRTLENIIAKIKD